MKPTNTSLGALLVLHLFVLLFSIRESAAQEAPAFSWVGAMAGSASADHAETVTTDAAGNVYTTGFYVSTVDFDPGAGVFNLTSAGSEDIFISKLDANGNFVWTKSIGSTNAQVGVSITSDALGNLYIAGTTFGTVDFDPGAGVFNLVTPGPGNDVFVLKLDANGNFIWAKSMGNPSGAETVAAIDIDLAGNVYTAGIFAGTGDFDPGPGTSNLLANGSSQDVFISKLDINGNFVWAKLLGGLVTDEVTSLTVDASGNVYSLGAFYGAADFDPGTGVFTLTPTVGGPDMFISKLDTDGNFVWAKRIGDVNLEDGREIAADGAGNVCAVGRFSGTLDFDPGAGIFNLAAGASNDVFILKLNGAGNFVWAKSVESASASTFTGNSLAVDGSNNVISTGYFSGTYDFDPGAGIFNLTSASGIFFLKLDGNGNFIWATSIGPVGSIISSSLTNSVTTDASGNVIGTGGFNSTADFDDGPCIANRTGALDIFVTKLSLGTVILPPSITSFAPASGPVGTTVTITGTNFSTTPANNAVTFNSTPAVVTASTSTSITTTVPAGTTIGQIEVTKACFIAISASSFTVTPPLQGLEWAKAHVGSLDTFLESMTTDPAGNVYNIGVFSQTTDFDPGPGVFNLTSAGNFDIFISKLNSNGIFQWAVRIGGTSQDDGRAITCDALGNIYVAGTFVGPLDFDPGAGTTTLPGPGNAGFVAKFDTNGNFVWADQIANNLSGPWSLIVDSFNDLCVASAFTGTTDFDPGAPVVNLTSAGSADIFIMKLSSAGNFVWARRMGSTLSDVANRIALDAGGNLLTTGSFVGTVDFDPGAGTSNLTSAGSNDMFISKLSSAGNFVWARRVGGTGAFDIGYAIASDGSSNVYTTGAFSGTVDFDPGGPVNNLTSAGSQDTYVLKLNSLGTFVWARNMGGISDDIGVSISVDASQNVISSGFFRQTADFDPGAGTFALTTANNRQVYVSALDGLGNFSWAISTDGGTLATAEDPTISFDASGNLFLAGIVDNGAVDFDPSSCVNSLSAAFVGAFIVKLSPNAIGCAPLISSFTPSSGPVGTTVIISGINFSGTPSNNTVRFNGILAVVTASSSTSLTVTVPSSATTGPITVTVAGVTATSSGNFSVTNISSVVIAPASLQTSVGGQPTLDLVSLITSDNTVDIASIIVTVQPLSGAIASISSGVLTVNYEGISFSGTDQLTIEACNVDGNCAQQQITIEVTGEIVIYNAISPNGDAKNELFYIENINMLADTKDNKVTVFNRWGEVVFEVQDYDNLNQVFKGQDKNGQDLPSGTYYYKITFDGGAEPKTGFISLKR